VYTIADLSTGNDPEVLVAAGDFELVGDTPASSVAQTRLLNGVGQFSLWIPAGRR
jgi:hypothetical protein